VWAREDASGAKGLLACRWVRELAAQQHHKPSIERFTKMKTLLPKLVKCRFIQAGGLLAVIAVLSASIGSSSAPEARIQLGGAWIAQLDNGARGLVTYGATDPSGQRTVFRAQVVWPPEMLAGMRLDAVTDEIAEEVVTGKDTSAYTGICYGLAGGRIVLIFVDNTTSRYVSPTQRINEHTLAIYLASADADNDGYPDPGTSPIMTSTSKSIGKRVAR
jgi:hypothetical protein